MDSLGTMLRREGKARKVKRKGEKYISSSHTLPLPRQAPKMTKEMAMKVLGLTKAKKVAKKIEDFSLSLLSLSFLFNITVVIIVIVVIFIDKVTYKKIEDFSENEITSAFQTQCTQLSEWRQKQLY